MFLKIPPLTKSFVNECLFKFPRVLFEKSRENRWRESIGAGVLSLTVTPYKYGFSRSLYMSDLSTVSDIDEVGLSTGSGV